MSVIERLEWWLDDYRMVEPLFWPGDEAPDPLPHGFAKEGLTVVLPGHPDYFAATQRVIDNAGGVIVWADRCLGIVDACGVRGVLLHRYLTETYPLE